MNGDAISKKLGALNGYAIVFTPHAELRLVQRQVDRNEVMSHLRNPSSLRLCEKLQAEEGEEKYKLWFIPYKRTAYICIIVINHPRQTITVKTVVKQKLMWQRRAEKYAK